MLRPRGCVWGPESGPPFKNKIGVRACVCACFPDAISTRSPGGSWSSLEPAGCLSAPCAPGARPGEPGNQGEAPPVAAKGNLMGRPAPVWGLAGSRRVSGRVPAGTAAGGLLARLGAGPGPLPPRRDPRASCFPPAARGSAWPRGFVTALVLARGGPAPGGHRARGGPWPRSRPSAQRLRVPASAPGPAWRAGPDPPRGGAGEGRE